MARGYMYQINTSMESIGSMSAESCADDIDIIGTQWLDNRPEDEAVDDIASLRRALEKAGFLIRDPNDEEKEYDDDGNGIAFVIGPMDKDALVIAQCAFFEPYFEALKKKLSETTLHDFATDTGTVFTLQSNIDDEFDDVILHNGSYYTVHRFIRSMTPGYTYYVATNTVLMH